MWIFHKSDSGGGNGVTQSAKSNEKPLIYGWELIRPRQRWRDHDGAAWEGDSYTRVRAYHRPPRDTIRLGELPTLHVSLKCRISSLSVKRGHTGAGIRNEFKAAIRSLKVLCRVTFTC